MFQLAHVFISVNIKSKNELDFSTEALISSCICNCSMNVNNIISNFLYIFWKKFLIKKKKFYFDTTITQYLQEPT